MLIQNDGYVRHSRRLILTGAAHHAAEKYRCFWFLDIIDSHQRFCFSDEQLRDMQFWSLQPWTKTPPTTAGKLHTYRLEEGQTPKARAICSRDTDDAALCQEIEYTDFPFAECPELKIWVSPTETEAGERILIAMLPEDY